MTLVDLFKLIRQHLALVVILPVVAAVATFGYTHLFMPNQYTATTSMYVLATSQRYDYEGESTDLTLTNSLNASQQISKDVTSLVRSSRVKKEAAADLGLPNLNGYSISVKSENNTRIITITVTGPNPQTAADIANSLAANVSSVAQEIMRIDSVNVIDEALAPTSPSGPNRLLYTMVAFFAGLLTAVVIIVLVDLLNTRVRDSEDAEALLGIPVIGKFPNIKDAR